jgi:hypothetical protein
MFGTLTIMLPSVYEVLRCCRYCCMLLLLLPSAAMLLLHP